MARPRLASIGCCAFAMADPRSPGSGGRSTGGAGFGAGGEDDRHILLAQRLEPLADARGERRVRMT
jgi:hypothetical protein